MLLRETLREFDALPSLLGVLRDRTVRDDGSVRVRRHSSQRTGKDRHQRVIDLLAREYLESLTHHREAPFKYGTAEFIKKLKERTAGGGQRSRLQLFAPGTNL